MLNYKNKNQSLHGNKRGEVEMHNLKKKKKTAKGDLKLLSASGWFVCVCGVGGWLGEQWGRGGAWRGGSYLWPAAGASEKEEEEEGGEWALGGPVEGVGGGEGLPPIVPDWAICCLSWVIVRSSFSRASRSLRSSSCSSCRSASACSSLWRNSDNWQDRERDRHEVSLCLKQIRRRLVQHIITFNNSLS